MKNRSPFQFLFALFLCVFAVLMSKEVAHAQTVIYQTSVTDPTGDISSSNYPDITNIDVSVTSDYLLHLTVTFAPGVLLGEAETIFYFSRNQGRKLDFTDGTYENYGIDGTNRVDLTIYGSNFQGNAKLSAPGVANVTAIPVTYSGNTVSTTIPLSQVVGTDDGRVDLRVVSLRQLSSTSNNGIADDAPAWIYASTPNKELPLELQLPLPPIPPEITSEDSIDAEFGEFISYQITATHSPTSYSIDELPAGMSLSAEGLLEGVPTDLSLSADEEGFTTTIHASNAYGTGSLSLTIYLSIPEGSTVISLDGKLNFGKRKLKTKTTKKFTIHNDGDDPIKVTSIRCPKGFSAKWSGTIDGGESKTIVVTFSPASKRLYSGFIRVNSNADFGENTLPISGKGK